MKFINRQTYMCVFILCICFSLNVYSQTGTITGPGLVTFKGGHQLMVEGQNTFTSHISPNGNANNMVQIDAISLLRLGADLKGNIQSCIADKPDGYAILSIYAYDRTTFNKGALLYRIKGVEDLTSTEKFLITSPVDVPSPFGPGTIKSDQIKYLMRGATTWLVDPAKCNQMSGLDLFTTTMAYINYQANPLIQSQLNDCIKGNNYRLLQPVIVELEAQNVSFVGLPDFPDISFPGKIEDFYIADYFNPDRAIEVQVKVNGELKQTYKAGNENPTPIDITLGDVVSYDVKHYGKQSPKIEGMPGLWIARFAGDLMYYCSPSIQPDEFNPWIGYDSRVHTLQLRNIEGDPSFKVRVPDWYVSVPNSWSWSWYAQRRMDANKSKYEASHTWIKYKTLSSGAKQRNNQREGLNVQFLNYWQQGENSDFHNYLGDAKYMMGFDDDELLYLNSQYHDAIHHPPLAGGGIAKLDSIPSRGMPEGFDQIYDVATGYPAQGFPLNMVISAYRKNREWLVKHNSNYFEKYNGYEVQDNGTNDQFPDGNGTGNNMAPGTVIVRAGGQVVTIKMNVKAPLKTDKGQYGSLEGNRWPAYNEKDMPYTLTGLESLSISELDKFSMEYEGSDDLGNLSRQTKYLKNLPDAEKNTIASTGKWTATFNNDHPTYSTVTAYYQRTPESERVIVSGKELKSIFLLFFSEKSLEGEGLGAKIWLNDFRDTKTAEYSEVRLFGNKTRYMKPNVREYVFPVGTNTVYQTWDGDPHLFYSSSTEWFLSSRTLAKRITDDYLDGTNPTVNTPYLRYYIDGVEQTDGRKGKEFSYTWNTPGSYILKVEYRTEGGLTTYQHKITIYNFPSSQLGKNIGSITRYPLSEREGRWLGISDIIPYVVYEVRNVYSQHVYKDGPRANTPYENRWAEFNDYASEYKWNMTSPNFVTDFINNYNDLNWFWYNWALHYSSNWRDHLPNGLPPYVGNNQVTRVITTELDKFAPAISELFNTVTQATWQYTVPLVSYTDYQGNRMRTNPSCLYDLNTVWSNEYGAFTGNAILPDPGQIQAPDITDEQKDLQEFYYDLKSSRKIVLKQSEVSHLIVRNIFGGKDILIAEISY
jgi:hypothetical protein